MDTEEYKQTIKHLLEENKRLLTENNLLLRKMRRREVISSIVRISTWVIFFGAIYYSYVSFVKPNLENLEEKIQSLEKISVETESIKEFMDSLKSSFAKPGILDRLQQ